MANKTDASAQYVSLYSHSWNTQVGSCKFWLESLHLSCPFSFEIQGRKFFKSSWQRFTSEENYLFGIFKASWQH